MWVLHEILCVCECVILGSKQLGLECTLYRQICQWGLDFGTVWSYIRTERTALVEKDWSLDWWRAHRQFVDPRTEPKVCVVCGTRPAVRKIENRGYCINHTTEARADLVKHPLDFDKQILKWWLSRGSKLDLIVQFNTTDKEINRMVRSIVDNVE